MVDEPVWEIPVHAPKRAQSKKAKESSPQVEADVSSPVEGDGSPPWYPSGLTSEALDPSNLELGRRTPWGRIWGWNYSEALDASWWQNSPDSWWGVWPKNVGSVRIVAHTQNKIIVALGEDFIVHIYPLQTGSDVSTLVRYKPWGEILKDERVILPIGGLQNDNGDQLCMFPYHEIHTPQEVSQNLQSRNELHALGDAVGRLHSALKQEATPNTEWRWNARLKAIEGTLKTTTLWRAPHTKHVQGLPPFHISLDGIHWGEDVTLVPQPRPLVDHLLCESERMPPIATLAHLEQIIALRGGFSDSVPRASFYAGWEAKTPPTWGGRFLRNLKGGVWIWRYEAILLELARARAFKQPEAESMCMGWLNDVSRIQAKLGVLRMTNLGAKTSLMLFLLSLGTIFFTGEPSTGSSGGIGRMVLATLVLLLAVGLYRYTDRNIPEPY
ncbi:MAG: hypothetical protein P8Q40_07910 [Candidatus Poseidonia sp.]|uniref:hypothetical protein n=1 Tax=Poseidonia sp. TaxID=2666344 RepID=UPI0030C2C87E|nr:hypothetical protein [Poseidonia sp.]